MGSLYCYVDPAKSMTSNEKQKIIPKSCKAIGYDKCTLVIVPTTTEADREHFAKMDDKLLSLNPYLVRDF